MQIFDAAPPVHFSFVDAATVARRTLTLFPRPRNNACLLVLMCSILLQFIAGRRTGRLSSFSLRLARRWTPARTHARTIRSMILGAVAVSS